MSEMTTKPSDALPSPAYRHVARTLKAKDIVYLDLPLAMRAAASALVYLDPPKETGDFAVVRVPLPDRKRDGKQHISVHNTGTALELLGVTIRHDRFTDRVELQGVDDHDRLTDGAERLILTALETINYRVSLSTLHEHLLAVAEANAYDSMVERFARLESEWDRVPRLDKWMHHVLRTEDDAYHDFWSATPLIVAVMRVRRATLDHPIAYKYLPVLESPQDGRKSSALRVLGFTRYFTDDLKVGSDAKETIELSGGVLIAELSELAARKKDIESQKAFISKATDKARMAYGRNVKEVPRRFVLYASTNDAKYLKDETGDVRYIPIACGISQDAPADTDWLAENLDQLWGEAAARESKMWESGDWRDIYPPLALSQHARTLQDARYDGGDAYEELRLAIEEAFAARGGQVRYAFVRVETASRIAGYDETPLAQNPSWGQALKKAMTRLGWREKRRRLSDGERCRGYEFGIAYDGRVNPEDVLEHHEGVTRWLSADLPVRGLIRATREPPSP